MQRRPYTNRCRVTAEEALAVAEALKRHLYRLGINPEEVVAQRYPGLQSYIYNPLISPRFKPGVVHEYPIEWIRKFIDAVDATRAGEPNGNVKSGIEKDPVIAAILERDSAFRQRHGENIGGKTTQISKIISVEEAPAIAEALKDRIAKLGVRRKAIERQSNISNMTLHKILSGESSYRRSKLEALQHILDELEQNGVSSNDMKHTKTNAVIQERSAWGQKIWARREELGLTLEALGDHVGITRERMRQIEAGGFNPDSSTIKIVLMALGYPRTEIDTLDKDTPQLPGWVEQRNREIEETSTIRLHNKQKIGHALRALRMAKGISAEQFGKKIGHAHSVIFQIESGHFSDTMLKEVLSEFRLKNADQLMDYVKAHGIEQPHIAAHQREFELLYTASRILRTHWNLKSKDMEKHCAPAYKISAVSIMLLENPNHPYGKEKTPSLEAVIGLIAALYNADGQQPIKHQVLHELPNVRRIAGIANNGQTLTYGTHGRQLLERAITDIVDTALEVEKGVYDPPAPEKDRWSAVGLRHMRNTDHRSLAEMVSQLRNNGQSR